MATIPTLGRLAAEKLEEHGESLQGLVEEGKLSEGLGEDLKIYQPRHPYFSFMACGHYDRLMGIGYNGEYTLTQKPSRELGYVPLPGERTQVLSFKTAEAVASYLWVVAKAERYKETVYTFELCERNPLDFPLPGHCSNLHWMHMLVSFTKPLHRHQYSKSGEIRESDDEEITSPPPALTKEAILEMLQIQKDTFLRQELVPYLHVVPKD